MCRWASVGQATYAHAMAKANQKHTNTHTHTSAYICTISDWGSDKHTTHRTPQKTEQTLFMIRGRLKLLSLVLIALLLNYPCVLPQQLLLLLRAALRVYCSFFPAFIRRIEIEGSIHFSKGARKKNTKTTTPQWTHEIWVSFSMQRTLTKPNWESGFFSQQWTATWRTTMMQQQLHYTIFYNLY